MNSKDKSLPWWVEFLFVQIGLPDKFLIKILKQKNLLKNYSKMKKDLYLNVFYYYLSLSIYIQQLKNQKTN